MAFHKQRFNTDCGVCVVAIIADVSWEKAKEKLALVRPGWKPYYTHTKQVRRALYHLGWYTPQARLKVVPNRLWTNVPNCAIVKIIWDDTYKSHWVVKRKGKVYDPAMGVFSLERYVKINPPSSYMEFSCHGNQD